MYSLYSLGGVTFNKCWITLSILNCYSPNFQGFILMKNALNKQVGMLGDMFLWLVANLKEGVIYFIKQGGGNHKIAWVYFQVLNPMIRSIWKEIWAKLPVWDWESNFWGDFSVCTSSSFLSFQIQNRPIEVILG